METTLIPENKEISKDISDVSQKALALRVTDVITYQQAGELLILHKDMKKKIEEFFEPHVKKANELHKSLTSARKAEIDKLIPGSDHLSKEMTAWNIEQEKIRKAEEDRLRQEALKREEEERLQAAIQAEQEGSTEEAAAILEEPVYVPPPIVQSNVPKQAGLTMQTTYKHRVTNLMVLIKAVAEGKAPIVCIQADDQYLGATARNNKGLMPYPGVEFFEEKSMKGTARSS